MWWNSVLNGWTQSSDARRSYSDFNIWPYDLEHVLYVALASGIIFTNLSTTYPCLNYSVFWCWYVMSRCDFDVWLVDLESLWYTKRHVIKVCTKFELNRAIPGWIIDDFANFAHVMSRYDLDLWPLDLELLQHFACHAFKLCTKFERNRINHDWVIDDDDLSLFRCTILEVVGHFYRAVLRDVWT